MHALEILAGQKIAEAGHEGALADRAYAERLVDWKTAADGGGERS